MLYILILSNIPSTTACVRICTAGISTLSKEGKGLTSLSQALIFLKVCLGGTQPQLLTILNCSLLMFQKDFLHLWPQTRTPVNECEASCGLSVG